MCANSTKESRSTVLEIVANVAAGLTFLVIYVPAAGHGFLSDDFRWILNSRLASAGDVVRLFRITDGFYRPLVSLTFGLDHLLFGLNPLGYGLTNVGLALVTAFLIRRLAITMGLPGGAGTLAGSLWLLNFHGINLSILWVSGRTALLVTLFATSTAIFVVKRRLMFGLLSLLCALLSKEEAVTLPIVLMCWLVVLPERGDSGRWRTAVIWAIGSSVVMAMYLTLRSTTGAMTPATAPSYYQFTFTLPTIARNGLQYLDRAVTTSAIAVVLTLLILGARRTRIDARSRRLLACGLVWLVGGYGITVFLPVRSSLYALVPSIGPCLIAATLATVLWESSPARRRRFALMCAALVPVCLLPIYMSRMATVPLADFSQQAITDIREQTKRLPGGATVVILDDTSTRMNIASAFGTLLNEAVLLETGRPLNVWVEPAQPGTDVGRRPCASCADLRLRVMNGRVVPLS